MSKSNRYTMYKFTIILCLFALSCTNMEPESNLLTGQITKIESLANIALGQSDTIEVTFSGGTDGCAKPDHLEAIVAGTTIIFKAYYNYPSKPTVCPSNIPGHQLKYIFKPTTKGTYNYQSFDTDARSETKVN